MKDITETLFANLASTKARFAMKGVATDVLDEMVKIFDSAWGPDSEHGRALGSNIDSFRSVLNKEEGERSEAAPPAYNG